MGETGARGCQYFLIRCGFDGTIGTMDKQIMVRHVRSPVLLGRDCPSPESAHRSAAVRAARSALASTGHAPRAGLDGETDGVRSKEKAIPSLLTFGGEEKNRALQQRGQIV